MKVERLCGLWIDEKNLFAITFGCARKVRAGLKL
jgi:hypothetical protein